MRKPGEKCGILTVGMGAVASTFFAGVEAIKRKKALPIGSFTQMGKIDGRAITDICSLADLNDLVFGGWDIFPDNAYEAARKSGVLSPELLKDLKPALSKIRPFRGAFDAKYVKALNGPFVKKSKNKSQLVAEIRADIRSFLKKNRCDRGVLINCSSTEAYAASTGVHKSLAAFEKGLRTNNPSISPSALYVYAALKEGLPVANATPNRMGEQGWLSELSEQMGCPVAGSDLKTGQTLIKTILAPGLRERLLGVRGWYSTNILGNRDGLVLSDPDSFRSKEISKSQVLDDLFSKKEQPDLYRDLVHRVDIHYYPPRGDEKEGWDTVDLFGWLGYQMQIKINFLGRDSILAAPLVLDLALLLDAAKLAGRSGVQEWLGFFFKSPLTKEGKPENDLFRQHARLQQAVLTLAE